MIKSVFRCLRYATCKLLRCIKGVFKNFLLNLVGLIAIATIKPPCCLPKDLGWGWAVLAAVLLFFFSTVFIFICAFLECLFCGAFGNLCCGGCRRDFIGNYGYSCCFGGCGCNGCAPVRVIIGSSPLNVYCAMDLRAEWARSQGTKRHIKGRDG